MTIEQWGIMQKDLMANLHIAATPSAFVVPADDTRKARAIQQLVAERFHLTVKVMLSDQRPNYIAWPRQIAMYLCRECTDLTLHDIGRLFRGKDHGTILHAVKTVNAKYDTDARVRVVIEELKAAFGLKDEASNL